MLVFVSGPDRWTTLGKLKGSEQGKRMEMTEGKQFSRIALCEEQAKRFGCIFQRLDDVEFSYYATLGNPFAEVSQCLDSDLRSQIYRRQYPG